MTKRFTQKDIDRLKGQADGSHTKIYEYQHPIEQESMEFTVKVKPMSINEAYTGRRYKTERYRIYCKDVIMRLRIGKLKEGKYQVYYRFGLSNSGADWDNPVKPFQDIISKFFRFNDKKIRRAVVEIDEVPKGSEYIFCRIEKI